MQEKGLNKFQGKKTNKSKAQKGKKEKNLEKEEAWKAIKESRGIMNIYGYIKHDVFIVSRVNFIWKVIYGYINYKLV